MLVYKKCCNLLNLPTSVLKINKDYIHIYYINIFYYIYLPFNGHSVIDLFNLVSYTRGSVFYKKSFLSYFLILKWSRVMFKGKGFRVRLYRKSGKVVLNFGYSHWTRLKFGESWNFFKLRRQNYLFFSTIDLFFINFCRKILVRKLNRYTQRGLRLKKQIIKRRFGKISQYISSLH